MSFTGRKGPQKARDLKPRCYRCARARAVKHVPPYGYLCGVCRKLVNDGNSARAVARETL
jgi:hypothetical protein